MKIGFGDFVQAASVILLVVGSWESGNARTRAFLYKLAANVCVVAVGLLYGVWSSVVLGIAFSCLQVRAVWKWRAQGRAW